MKKTIYTMTALAAVILAAAGCAKQEAGTQGPASLMSIEPEVEGTKAELINDATGLQGQGFGVSIYNGTTPYKDKVEMVYSGSVWTHPSDATDWKWPSNTVYTFYAWSPADLAVGSVTSTGVPAFTYSGIANQTDIMLGCYTGTGTPGENNTCAAPVKFSHALASVQFKTGTMTGLGNITKIELSGVATSGTCTPTMSGSSTTFAWSGISSSTTTLTQSSLTVATTTSGTTIGTPFLTLPQSTALTVTLTDANSKTVSAALPANALTVGHTAVYTINYEAGKGLNFTCDDGYDPKPWSAEDEVEVVVDEYTPQQPDNEIWYIASEEACIDRQAFDDAEIRSCFGGANLIDHKWDGHMGRLIFDKELTSMSGNGTGCTLFKGPISELYLPQTFTSLDWFSLSVTSVDITAFFGYGVEYVDSHAMEDCRVSKYTVVVGDSDPQVLTNDGFDWNPVLKYGPNLSKSIKLSYSCFVKGTLITLADGSKKPVEELNYEDDIKVWNFDEGHVDSANILWLSKKRTADHYFRCTFSDGSTLGVVGTDHAHRLFNYNDKFFEGTTDIKLGTEIFTEHGVVTLVSCERIDEEVEYYNLITDKDINCYANEVLTSCRYSNIYPVDENMKFVKDGRKRRPYSEFKAVGISREWYNGMRLGEQTYDIEDIAKYIERCESRMLEKPAPTFWQKLRTWWKSIFG